jgi:hypothetical protein
MDLNVTGSRQTSKWNILVWKDAVLQPDPVKIFASSDIAIPNQVLLVMFWNIKPTIQSTISIYYGCSAFSFFKDVRKPIQLDPYQIIFIRNNRQKENIKLLNEDDGTVK